MKIPLTGPVFVGTLAALVICAASFLFSLLVSRRVENLMVRRGLEPGVAGFFTGMFVRFAFCVGGIIAVALFFGKTTVVPCALAMMPLCFVEVMCSMAVHLRRVKRRSQPSEPMSSQE